MSALTFELASRERAPNGFDFEQLVFCQDERVGLKAIIGIHSTALGPATGGCRRWTYKNEHEALADVLRLSQGMTYKAAVAGLHWGGGKAVIWAPEGFDPKREPERNARMLERFGEFVAGLSGNYITAKDVGISSDDLRIVKRKTTHVLGIDGEPGTSGDPSPATAWGVYHGIRASVQHALGAARSLSGLTVALQGLGSVSYALLEHLHKDGARLIGCDVNLKAIERARTRYPIEIVEPDAIYDVQCDVFSPGALGSSITRETLPRLRVKVIAGAANNQLAEPALGQAVLARGITYAPDYVINAGGLINIYHERMVDGGYHAARAFDHVAKIGATLEQVLARASTERKPPHEIADRIAEERVSAARSVGVSTPRSARA